jgi:hypothetical protein
MSNEENEKTMLDGTLRAIVAADRLQLSEQIRCLGAPRPFP